MPYWLAPVPVDDVDIGVADLVLDLLADLVEVVAVLGEQVDGAEAGDGGQRPQQYLGGAVFAYDERVDVAGTDPEPAGEVDPETQAVDEGAGREHAVVSHQFAGEVGKRIGRVGDHHDHGVGSVLTDAGDDVAVDRGVVSSNRSLPSGSDRSVAPPVRSLAPAVTTTRSAPVSCA